MTEQQYIKWTNFKFRFKQMFCRRVPIVLIELDRKKFKIDKSNSCTIHASLPNKANAEDRKKIQDNLNETIDLIRKYL